MTLSFFDPRPFRNDYVSKHYFAAMRDYARRNGIAHKDADTLCPETGCALVCNAEHLTPTIIRWFKDNGCPIYAFSCVDSAYLASTIRHGAEAELIDRIFVLAGLQLVNSGSSTVIDGDFRISSRQVPYLPEDDWQRYTTMRLSGQMVSLPYTPWNSMAAPERVPFEQRRPTVLFRGGHHFFRVLGFYSALARRIADPECGFHTEPYFSETMNPQFQYCQKCREAFRGNGRRYPLGIERGVCTSEAAWGGVLDFTTTCWWNNRCPKSFYWLAEEFAKRHGAIDMKAVENAMNHRWTGLGPHLSAISRTRFYGDAKWEFTINTAQRFWEAAISGTANLLPRRTNEQEYFPALRDGEHYLTFADDFSDLNAEIEKERFEHITSNAMKAWEEWIKPTDYALSTNLLKRIFDLCNC